MIFLNGGKKTLHIISRPGEKTNNNEESCDRNILNIYIFFFGKPPNINFFIKLLSVGTCTLKF